MRSRLVVAAALLAIAWALPHVRHRVIADIITWDAPPSEPATLPAGPTWSGAGLPRPAGDGIGLAPARLVRVVLIDGLSADTARTLPAWSAMCNRGITLDVDVGFPTISLPVEVALWTGLTQQQTGVVFRSDRAIVPPLATSIPAHVAGSRAIAESHGYIVRSLGFADAQPAADPNDPSRDADDDWSASWQALAHDAVASDARLVFVHILRVDTAGHHSGHDSDEYRAAAAQSDQILATLVAAAPAARWFLLSDHGHLAGGGHGGEERAIRQVEGCIVGPNLAPAHGGLVHVVDVARAIADSVGVRLELVSRGRPMSVALAAPLAPDQAMPPIALIPTAIAMLLLALGGGVASWGARRWWLAPWWFVLACAALVIVRGVPTLSMPMVYAPAGRAMYVTWLPALAVAAIATWIGLGRTTLGRVVVAQLALPYAAVAAAITACGAWPAMFGADIAPVVPHVTAWLSPLLLIAAHGSAAVALAVLGRLARSAFDRRARTASPRTAPAAE